MHRGSYAHLRPSLHISLNSTMYIATRSNVSLVKPARAQSPNSSPACAAPPIAASPGASQSFGIPLEGVEQQVSVFGGLINRAEGTLWTHVLVPRGWNHHRRGSSPGPEGEPEAAIDLQNKKPISLYSRLSQSHASLSTRARETRNKKQESAAFTPALGQKRPMVETETLQPAPCKEQTPPIRRS